MPVSDIHLFEPTGYAGVFQHTCRLAMALSARGHSVALHTGHEHEPVDLDGVQICACSFWPRPSESGKVRAALRKLVIIGRLITGTSRHLVRSMRRNSVLHVQGVAASGALNLLVMLVARGAGHRVVYSPHDVFSRRGPVDGLFLRLACRIPHAVVVYSRADARRLRGSGLDAHLSPLVQLVPMPSDQDRDSWRREWQADGDDTVVLFAGYVRPEKRLDVLVESARDWPSQRRLAVVGPDHGGWAYCDDLARRYAVDIAARLEFVALEEFTAAIAAADLVVVPSDQASQSGVLVLARELQTPSVAADVGGMGELACGTFTAGDARDLSRAIDEVLAGRGLSPARTEDDDEAATVHLDAYGLVR